MSKGRGFVDRRQDLSFLEDRWQADGLDVIVITGRRRVGETTLLKAFMKDKPHVYHLINQEEQALQRQRLLGHDDFPDAFTYLWINQDTFTHATQIFQAHPDQGLSFTDATNIATIQHHDLDALLSFDTDDDGLVNRIDPRSLD